MERSTNNQKGVIQVLIVIVVFVAAFVAVVVFARQKNSAVTQNEVEMRVNPDPLSPNSLFATKVNPGAVVIVDSVEVNQKSHVAVYLDDGTELGKLLGKSTLLDQGKHPLVSIALSQAVKDGDVVSIQLLDENNDAIVDDNSNPIELVLNVGMVMSHYEDEY